MHVLVDLRTLPPTLDPFLHALFRHAKQTQPVQLTTIGPVPVSWRDLVDSQVEHVLCAPSPTIFVQPNPITTHELSIETLLPTARRYAFLDTDDKGSRRALIGLKHYHALYTLNDARARTWRHLLGPNSVIRTATPDNVWHEWTAVLTPIRRTARRWAIIAETACADRVSRHTQRVVRELATWLDVTLIDRGTLADNIEHLRNADRTLFVVADTPTHAWVADWHARWGGVLLLHGEFLGHLWHGRYGLAAVANLAEREVNRPVSPNEARLWLMEPHTCRPRFLGESTPFVVHSEAARMMLAERSLSALRLPISVEPRPLVTPNREAPLLLVSAEQAIEAVQACELLASWRVPLVVAWVGDPPWALLKRYGLARRVQTVDQPSTMLTQTHVALVLRNAATGDGSSLLDACLAAGIPCVTTHAETRLWDGPEYLFGVPDRLSPLLIAEAVRTAWNMPNNVRELAHTGFLRQHSASHYAEQLRQALGEP